ncbi:MAG: type II secretion system minor pseudopilin GspK [Wenzhouxiangellaceae bacterium]|nr:type II secretion system minor pseudopilin GspK [Wenzhouxiangellaceae bacterium]
MKVRAAAMRGAALLIALLLVASASLLVAELVRRSQLDVQRALLIADSERAWQLAAGVDALVRARLRRAEGDASALVELGSVRYPIPGGQVLARVIDPGGRFNLNALAVAEPGDRAQAAAALRRLLLAAGVDPQTADRRIAALVEALPAAGDGAAGLWLHPSELAAVPGWDPALRARLTAWITTLPDAGAPLNVNQAPVEVLAAWIDGLGREAAARLQARAPFDSLDQALSTPELQLLDARELAGRLTVRSPWLLVHTRVELDGRAHDQFRLIRRAGTEYDARYLSIGSD